MPAPKRPPLSKKRQQYAQERGGFTFVGKPLSYPAGVAERYQRELDRMIRPMIRAYERELRKIMLEPDVITQDASTASRARIALNSLARRFQKLFNERAPILTDRMLGGVDKHSELDLKQSLKDVSGGLTLKTTNMPAALRESFKAAAVENVSLIKSIPSQYHERIEGAVMRSIQVGGEGRKTLMDELTNIGGMSERRARNIANDQVRKATTTSNTERAKALGIKKFKWLHSGGGFDKRQKHVDASGKTYSYDNPPRIGDKGEPVLPGYAINCRCRAVPVIEWD
ncbi:head morphogenesis protein [Pseudomonas phage vB_PcuM_ KLEP17-4]|nr:head morphogenesis protein [Pseudomonas phage vB_PcuM_ KLEP17-4]